MYKIAIVIALLLTGCTSSPQWRAAVAERGHAPGWQRENQCAPFAHHMAARIPGAKVVQWQATYREDQSAFHQAVQWNVGNEIWMMDNSSDPVWVGYVFTPQHDRILQFIGRTYREPATPFPSTKITVATHPKE